jgi:glycosyltransferase involved in cell wall biosynthesis
MTPRPQAGHPPAVSVFMPAYNHAPFVVAAVRSILDQSFGDFELLIADDGSRDGTPEAIRSVADPRIDFTAHAQNRGAVPVHNELVARCRGRYVALLNSDDLWLPGKLATQVAFLDANPGIAACFARPRLIDREGHRIDPARVPFARAFAEPNRPRGAWLRYFFSAGNCLCHPSMLIRREALLGLGPYDGRYRQLPDFEMWTRLARHHAFTILDEELVGFRVLPGENVSGASAVNRRRIARENQLIIRGLFDGVDAALLREGFADVLLRPALPTPEHLEIEKALLHLSAAAAGKPGYFEIGLERLHALLGQPAAREVLAAEYGIDDRAFHARAGMPDPALRGALLRRAAAAVLARLPAPVQGLVRYRR